MTPEERLNIIKFGLADIIGIEKLESEVLNGKTLKVYWGTCPTGQVHLGYLVPLIKISHLVFAGCEVTILIADLHAQLGSPNTTWELIELRTIYYEHVIKQILLRLQTDITKIRFIKGSEFQLTTKYTIDVYKLMSRITVEETQESVKNILAPTSNPVLSGLIYPVLQILDEIYLETNCELGGLDQQKIFMMGLTNLSKIGHEPNIYLINQIIPNLQVKNYQNSNSSHTYKMSSSGKPESKINVTENFESIYKKIKNINRDNSNVLMSYLKNIIFPIIELLNFKESLDLKNNTSTKFKKNHKNKIKFTVMIDGSYGDYLGSESFNNFDELILSYKKDIINLHDLKHAVSKWIGNFFIPIKNFFSSEEMIKLVEQCYPN